MKKTMLFPVFSACFLIFSLLLFPSEMMHACTISISLWLTKVFPALFPFMVACSILLHTGAAAKMGKYFSPLTKVLFGLNGIAAFPFFLGILSGYPMGAKITAQLYENKQLTPAEAQHILTFSNNPGPLFLIGTVGAGFFSMPAYGYLLFFSSFLGAVTTGFLWRFRRNTNTTQKTSYLIPEKNISLSEILSLSVSDSIHTMLLIGGYLILFGSLTEGMEQTGIYIFLSEKLFFLPLSPDTLHGCVSGLLEMTNGAYLLSHSTNTLPLISFLVSFGGLSILSQTFGILSAVPISKKDYLKGKLINALFSSLFCYIFCHIFEQKAQKVVPAFSFFTETTFTLSFLWLMPSLFLIGVLCHTLTRKR